MPEREAISIRAIEPSTLPDPERLNVPRGIDAWFAQVNAQRLQVSPDEADAIIDEALRSTRQNYHPAR